VGSLELIGVTWPVFGCEVKFFYCGGFLKYIGYCFPPPPHTFISTYLYHYRAVKNV